MFVLYLLCSAVIVWFTYNLGFLKGNTKGYLEGINDSEKLLDQQIRKRWDELNEEK